MTQNFYRDIEEEEEDEEQDRLSKQTMISVTK